MRTGSHPWWHNSKGGGNAAKPHSLWAGSCCKVLLALLSVPLAGLLFPSRCLSATCVLPCGLQLPAEVGLHHFARLLLSQKGSFCLSSHRDGRAARRQ